MSQRIDSESDRLWRERSRGMSKRVAAFLSDFYDDLKEEGFNNDTASRIVLQSSSVVMEFAMKGIFK